ncbi:MAG: phage late control D family protein [Cellulosilyticaceae bacterium]
MNSEMWTARCVKLIVKYEKKDISKDIAKYMIGCSYTDNASGTADDIDITLEDKEGLWHGAWLPRKGDLIALSFYVENWNGKKDKQMLPCGKFTIDKFDMNGPPDVVGLKGQSIPTKTDIKNTKKTKSWKRINLSKIAMDIAASAGLTCLFESKEDTYYESVNQIKQSDISFLQNLCKKSGISLKVTNNKLVLFSQVLYEAKKPFLKLVRGKSNIISYSFSGDTTDTAYAKCTVKYMNPKNKKVLNYTYKIEGATGKTLKINEQVKTLEEAKKLAKNRLREKNKEENTATFTLLGDIKFVAGVTVAIEGWNAFDGKYIIQKATHNIIGGYTTDIELTKCLEGY